MPIAPFWWLTTASLHDELKTQAGGQRIDVVQIDLGECVHQFGVAPCTATGERCFKSWESCKDPANYNETSNSRTVSLCTPVSDLPVGWNLIPMLKSVTFDPGDVTPDDGIGKVGSVTINCLNAPHDDVGIDPYLITRSYDPLVRGTFWPRLRTRWPHYQGRMLRWYTGYLHSPFDLSNLKMRTYQIEAITGFGNRSGVSIKAKDPLKLADNERAQFPRKSTGKLAVAISTVGAVTQIDITTGDPSEYDLYPFETISAVRMKGEVFRYTGTTPILNGVRLTGVLRGPPGPYTTAVEAHDIGDEVQKCAWWDNMLPPTIMRWLLVLGGSVPEQFIDLAKWETLYTFWLGSQTLTRLVTEPEGVNSQLSDILLQSSSWGTWWDEVGQEIGYEVFRPAGIDETVFAFNDDNHFVNDTLVVDDVPDRLVNYCVIQYGQLNPTIKTDEPANYRNSVVSIDADSVSSREVGGIRAKTVFGVWHAATPDGVVQRIARRITTARGAVPQKVTFKVARKDDSVRTGNFVDITTGALRDVYGNVRTVRMRVVKADHGDDIVTYTAMQDFISDRYSLIAPTAYAGETWTTAPGDHKNRYIFIANNAGVFSDGTEGKRIF